MSKRRRTPPSRQQPQLTKAVSVQNPAGGVWPTMQQAAQQAATGGMLARPLPRPDSFWSVPYGPARPLEPSPINPVRPDSGRAEPRAFEYPTTFNLPGFGDRLVPWKVLRDAADQISIFRRCIDLRKNEVVTLDWDVVISAKALERAQRSSGQSKRDVQKALAAKVEPDIGRLVDFWEQPDPRNGHDFISWASKVLEEYFVLDAIAIYPRRTIGGDLFGFEVLDGSCYSDDTEVLTRNGWLRFADTHPDDEFATRNQKTHELEWQHATYFHRAPSDGRMYHFRSKALDLLVTGNHRMLVTKLPRALGGSRHREPGDVFVPAADLAAHGNGMASKIPLTSHWSAPEVVSFRLSASGRTNSLPFECSGDDFAAFMGAWLSEGSLGGEDQVVITQDPKSKGYEPFRELLARIFGREVCHTGANFVIGRRCLHDWLKQFGHAHEKFVPAVIKEMSARQLGIFWRFYMLGDGHYASDGREVITTTSPQIADDLQEVAQKLGYSASISRTVDTSDSVMRDGRVIRAENKRPKYTIRLSRTSARTWTVEEVPYSGDVFCVSVPNESLYVRRNGKPAWCGNTIKPLLDADGHRPMAPLPAYQQILHGFPRGEFIADEDPEGAGSYPSDELSYTVHNVRSFTPYGFSAVEQALSDGELFLRRMQWLRAEYTDGVMPSGWLMAGDGQADWTPDQLIAFSTWFNDMYMGNSGQRHRYPLLPFGMHPVEGMSDQSERYKPEYDLYLLKLVAAHFDTTIAELGHTEPGGLGSSGYHEGQADVQDRKATQPTLRRLQALCTRLMRRYLKAPPELEFRILGLESEDEDAADEVADRRVKSGRQTLNEDRDRTGLPRYTFPEADMPMVDTGRGVVFLEGASQMGPPGTLIGPPQAPPATQQPAEDVGGGQQPEPGQQPQQVTRPPAHGGQLPPQQPNQPPAKPVQKADEPVPHRPRGPRSAEATEKRNLRVAAYQQAMGKADSSEVSPSAGPKSPPLARVGTGPAGRRALGSGAAVGFDWGAIVAGEAGR